MFNIGFDLDNTIVDCHESFKQVSYKKLEDDSVFSLNNRELLRSYIRKNYDDYTWTQIQSEVYGPDYYISKPFSGCIKALENLSLDDRFN